MQKIAKMLLVIAIVLAFTGQTCLAYDVSCKDKNGPVYVDSINTNSVTVSLDISGGIAKASWTVANTFARYMGVNKNCDSFKVLGRSLKLGDFIALDRDADGNWDHMGCVTGVSTTLNKHGYYDVKVAQHSTNYNLWASSSDNDWENIGGKGGGYARVRR